MKQVRQLYIQGIHPAEKCNHKVHFKRSPLVSVCGHHDEVRRPSVAAGAAQVTLARQDHHHHPPGDLPASASEADG